MGGCVWMVGLGMVVFGRVRRGGILNGELRMLRSTGEVLGGCFFDGVCVVFILGGCWSGVGADGGDDGWWRRWMVEW